MTLDHLGEALNAIRPNTNGLISAGRYNCVAIGSRAYAVHCSFVSNEPERSHHGLEVPDHDGAIERPRNDLSEVGVEAGRGDTVLVTLEAALKRRVSDLPTASRGTSNRALRSLVLSSFHTILLLYFSFFCLQF